MFTSDKLSKIDVENIIPGCTEGECPYMTMHEFLMGSCDIAAATLHKMFGYDTYTRERNHSVHYYCKKI